MGTILDTGLGSVPSPNADSAGERGPLSCLRPSDDKLLECANDRPPLPLLRERREEVEPDPSRREAGAEPAERLDEGLR